MHQQHARDATPAARKLASRRNATHPGDSRRYSETPLICFSHLRWGFVWQRPQHLLTRMAYQRPVFVIEEPVFVSEAEPARLHVTRDAGVTILTPYLQLPDGFSRRTNRVIRSLLATYFLGDGEPLDAIVWYYTPMALGALPPDIVPSLVVYDAMDELKNFLGAPAALLHQEDTLLAAADLVFTGGPSLYRARVQRHPRTYCFPSGVDAPHFGRRDHHPPDDIAAVPKPIVGFYGVLDERIDLGLLDRIAECRPDWSLVLIGPVAKIDEGSLPHRPNIHYPGMRPYDALPAYLAQFDVAILPFALNKATEFISPTKTLEYLAGGQPVISTPVTDVVDLYGDVVNIAGTPRAFVAAIEHLLQEPEEQRAARRCRVEQILAEHDWDVIAGRMQELMHDVLSVQQQAAPRHGHASPAALGQQLQVEAGARGVGE
ncbi:MAG: glycosyltransferase [Chloroflexota bacterium]|nr:glycosyltransferase [Chloroflexota bacterium]